MSTTCPCCGSNVVLDRLLVDLNTNTVSFGGKTVKARPRVVEMLSAMLDAHPRIASLDYLRASVWTNEEYVPARSIRTQVWHARQVTENLGWRVALVWKRGYRLERIDPGNV